MIFGQDANRESLRDAIFTVNDYSLLFVELALNRFKYGNTPPGIDTRYLEIQLLTSGIGICFENKDNAGPYSPERFPFLSLGAANSYRMDVYGEPISRGAVGIDYNVSGLTPDNSVFFYNNKTRTGNIAMLNWYAQRMYDATNTADTNMGQQKFPVIVKAPKKLQLAFKNAIKKWIMGQPFILGDDKTGPELKDFECLNLNIPYIADKAFDYNRALWNECLTRLGIDNLYNDDKRERMITGEVEAQKESVNIYKAAYLDERKKAVDKFNELFGTDWTVEWNSEVNKLGALYNQAERPDEI